MLNSQNNKRHVLVIDDNVDAAESLCSLLCMLGHEASFCTDGSQGLAAAREQKPDLILLDIGMPIMDGFEVATEIRKTPELARCTVVALSAWSDERTKAKAKACGFNDHITKPADLSRIQDALELYA